MFWPWVYARMGQEAGVVLLGIDPGLAATGYGVVRCEGHHYRAESFGCLRTHAGQELGTRLLYIYDQVQELVRRHRPEVLVLERLYQLRDGSTGLSVGQAMGVVRLAATQAGLGLAEYSPTHVKMTLVGTGAADKQQIQFMVQRLLHLPEPPRPDHAADALALCVCHLHSGLSRAAGGRLLPAGPGEERIAAALREDEARRAAHRRREERS